MSTISISVSNFDPKEQFKDLDFWQELAGPMELQKDMYSKDYGFGLRNYIQHLYIINNKNDIKYYLVANVELTKDEIKQLGSFCQCLCCLFTKKLTNPSTWFANKPSADCSGCINGAFPSQKVIKLTRDNVNIIKI